MTPASSAGIAVDMVVGVLQKQPRRKLILRDWKIYSRKHQTIIWAKEPLREYKKSVSLHLLVLSLLHPKRKTDKKKKEEGIVSIIIIDYFSGWETKLSSLRKMLE